MKKTLIFLLASFIALPVLASTAILPEDIAPTPVVISTDAQSIDDIGVITDEKKDVLAEDTKTEEISTEPEILPPNEDDNIIKKKRDEFRLKLKNERENMRLELKKGKDTAATFPPQKSTLQKIKGFFKSLF